MKKDMFYDPNRTRSHNKLFNFILKYILEISLEIIPKLWYNTYTI